VERDLYLRSRGDLLGIERKWVKDRTEVMDSISIHEAKGRGKGKGTKKSRKVIKLEAVCFIPGRGFASQLVSRLRCITSCLLSLPSNLSFQGRRTAVHEQLRSSGLVRSGNSAIGLP
jgi:hypothetical protein